MNSSIVILLLAGLALVPAVELSAQEHRDRATHGFGNRRGGGRERAVAPRKSRRESDEGRLANRRAGAGRARESSYVGADLAVETPEHAARMRIPGTPDNPGGTTWTDDGVRPLPGTTGVGVEIESPPDQ